MQREELLHNWGKWVQEDDKVMQCNHLGPHWYGARGFWTVHPITLRGVDLRLGSHASFLGVSEMGSAKMGSAIDVRIDDAGPILKFRIGFSPWFSAVASHLRLSLLVGFGGIEAVDTEFPYRVPIVDGGAIAVPLFADPIGGEFDCQQQASITWCDFLAKHA